MPVSAGKKKVQNWLLLVNLDGVFKIGPRPWAAVIAQYKSAKAARGKKNALNTKSFRMLSTPRYTTNIFNSQNKKNVIAGPVAKPNEAGKMGGRFSSEGIHNRSIWYKAKPPIHVWIPNQPQATIALKIAGILAPFVPKEERTKTGNGMPYFAPARPFKIMGISTTVLPMKMVRIACHQFMPPSISEEANI